MLAQRTHEAAREGVVPLCEVSLWNPRESRETPHSGLMRQPTKEGPVSGILATVKLECKGFESTCAADCLKSIPVQVLSGLPWEAFPCASLLVEGCSNAALGSLSMCQFAG